MYCEFYQLTERPFNVTPDPRFLYLNARYREAIASLNYGITQRKGFITLIGEAGTGKTTLLKKLLEDLDNKTRSVFIFNTNVTFEEILEYIFAEFDLPVHNGKKLYMLQRLNSFLLEELRNGVNVALLIDEAQDLEFSVLEDLRLLSNLETAKEKILQIVLSGQPELGQKLSNPVLRQLRQRIGINCRLLPLSRDEITEYITYRLQAAGSPDLKLFTREAEDQIYHFSRGIPRLVNVVCDNALVIGYALGKKRIGADLIIEAASDLMSVETMGTSPMPEPTSSASPIVLSRESMLPRLRRQLPWRGVGIAAVAVAATAGVLSLVRRDSDNSAPTEVASEAPAAKFEVIRPGADVRPPAPPALPAAERPVGSNRIVEKPILVERVDPAGVRNDGHPVAAERPSENFAAAETPAGHPERGAGRTAAESEPLGELAAVGHGERVPAAAETAAEMADDERSEIKLDGMPFGKVVVRDGDSMSSIARRAYGQSSYTVLDVLKIANPELDDIDVISTGQSVRVPELRDGFPVLRERSGLYSLLVFSTPNQTRAESLQKQLRAHGFDTRLTPTKIGGAKRVFRVTVAGDNKREAVDALGQELQTLFRDQPRLAQLGGD